MTNSSMSVIKRNGQHEEVSFDKVLTRIRKCSDDLDINYSLIAQKTLARIYDGVKTSELDELAAQLAISLCTTHPDYGILASRIIISNHQKNTLPSFTESMKILANQLDKKGNKLQLISDEILSIIEKHGEEIDAYIKHERDFALDYFGFKTLERQQYLLRNTDGVSIERPQYLWMRVALALWGSTDLKRAFETYDLLSQKYFIHATPTNFNAGTPRQQLSSCFLLSMKDDSITGIYDTLKDCALISKYAGGIGLHIHNVRAKGSHIAGTNGTSNGIVPMLKNFNDTARYVDQCFTADTRVYTVNGWKAISEIQTSDVVLTSGVPEWSDEVGKHFGSINVNQSESKFNRVIRLLTHNYTGTLIEIQLEGFDKTVVHVTPEHPVLSLKCQCISQETLHKYIELNIANVDYFPVKELRQSDYVFIPKTVYDEYIDKNEVQHYDKKMEYNGLYMAKIHSINEIQFSGNLYDLEVENIHDYVVDGLGIVHNGGGKRNGSFAIYLEPWHADIEDFLKLKLNTGTEEERARDLFYALWISDLFMERVEADANWTLFCPHEAPGLSDVWGDKFKELYEQYEKEGRGRKIVPARKIWSRILDTQIETGTPYILYKDAANRKSNQQNLGTIKSSNLCTEIIEYSSPEETAVCNLASLALPTYVNMQTRTFNYNKLREVVRVVTRNLNRVIDINYYPTPETKTSNMRHRPIGLGVQGLADVFAMMRVPWESPKAKDVNQRIFEHIYYAALEESCEIAKVDGKYQTYDGSPISQGKLQFDLWNIEPLTASDGTLAWDELKCKIREYGVRNSLLMAPMPTASTSQILGFNECIEPFTSNIYTRRTLAGEFIVINKYLLRDLQRLDIWNEDMKQQIIANNGSIQGIDEIPESVQLLYKTAWEIKQKTLIDLAADRGAFICQSQSLNLFISDPTYAKLTSMHFHSWKKGLKAGQYYLRTKAPVMAQKFTVDPELIEAARKSNDEMNTKKYSAPEDCLVCGS
jgi:ribonucleoside-diphosphate reductase alpha subunit